MIVTAEILTESQADVLPRLSEGERHRLLVEWNQTAAPYPADKCVHELIAAQVQRTPEAIALSSESETWTYRAMDDAANRLARYLQKRGVSAESRVVILVERSPRMVIALLAVLKAGAAYVPCHPANPGERLAFMLDDTSAAVLLTERAFEAQLPTTRRPIIYLDAIWNDVEAESTEPLPVKISSENTIYIMYTSGSTGKPKGVQMPHRCIVNFLTSMQRSPGIVERDVVLALTTLSFDISVLELFLPLTVGAKIVVGGASLAVNAMALARAMKANNVTLFQATPAVWRLLVESGWTGNPRLKMLCGGEGLPRELAEKLLPLGAQLWNMYGPTETAVWSLVHRVESGRGVVSIGRPIANTQVYLLDEELEPVPVGQAGELHIGGAGVARGYLNRPELTAQKFIPDPFSNSRHARLYKTGDLARYQEDGTIEFLGRTDFQIKIHGHRIEPGEIESALSAHASIRQALVTMDQAVMGGRLIAYLGTRHGEQISASELRELLKPRLPEYMIPSAFVCLDSFPLNASGKVDRKRLPIPELKESEPEKGDAPMSSLERTIAEIWAGILQRPRIGLRENFFELGGHSLQAAQVISQLHAQLGVEVPPAMFFEKPTVSDLAQAVVDCKSHPAPRMQKISSRPSETSASIDVNNLSDEEVTALLRSFQEGGDV